jgi:hypothetical protein
MAVDRQSTVGRVFQVVRLVQNQQVEPPRAQMVGELAVTVGELVVADDQDVFWLIEAELNVSEFGPGLH